jgi:hypothetical protein
MGEFTILMRGSPAFFALRPAFDHGKIGQLFAVAGDESRRSGPDVLSDTLTH